MYYLRQLLVLGVILICLAFCSGCEHSGFKIETGSLNSSQPCPVKFYVSSIDLQYTWKRMRENDKPQTIALPNEMELIKKNLVAKYPDFFVEDKSKGVNVNFLWNIEYVDTDVSGLFFLGAFTMGIFPYIDTFQHTGKIVAMSARDEKNYQKPDEWPDGVAYNIKDTRFFHGIMFSPISTPLFAPIILMNSDLKSPYIGSTSDRRQTPFFYCEPNLRLFPAACIKYYDSLSYEEKQALDDIYNPQDIIFLTQ